MNDSGSWGTSRHRVGTVWRLPERSTANSPADQPGAARGHVLGSREGRWQCGGDGNCSGLFQHAAGCCPEFALPGTFGGFGV